MAFSQIEQKLDVRHNGLNLLLQTEGKNVRQLLKNARLYFFDNDNRFPDHTTQMTTIEVAPQEVKDECARVIAKTTRRTVAEVRGEIARIGHDPGRPAKDAA